MPAFFMSLPSFVVESLLQNLWRLHINVSTFIVILIGIDLGVRSGRNGSKVQWRSLRNRYWPSRLLWFQSKGASCSSRVGSIGCHAPHPNSMPYEPMSVTRAKKGAPGSERTGHVLAGHLRQRISHLGTPACGGLRHQGSPDMDGESPAPAGSVVQRIGIRSPSLRYDILARSVGAFCRIKKPSICQVKAFDGASPSTVTPGSR